MRQHRVIRRERTQDVAGEEHADQRQMDGEPRHQIADRDLGDPQPVGDVGQDAHDHEIAHAQHETGRDQRGDRQREEAFAPLLPTDGGTGHDRTPAVFLFFQTEHTLAAPPAAQGPRAPQTNQAGRHGPERAMRPSICPTTAIHIAAATDTYSPRATANPAEPRSASADPGLPSSP